MSRRRNPLHCIVPPHILIAMAQADDPETREWAMHSLLLSARFRGSAKSSARWPRPWARHRPETPLYL